MIGRGEVRLKDLSSQPIGKTGTNYSYSRVGNVAIEGSPLSGQTITFNHLDLRPANGPDLKITIRNVNLDKVATYSFKARYSTSKPKVLQSPGTGTEIAVLYAVGFISDFQRIPLQDLRFKEQHKTYTQVNFKWNAGPETGKTQVLQSLDQGKTWTPGTALVNIKNNRAHISGLMPNQQYRFKLKSRSRQGDLFSNEVRFYTGKIDVREFDIIADE